MAQELKRGEVYWLDWGPGKGSEQRGIRPSLVIQNDEGNASSPTTIIAAITAASERDYPFMVTISAGESGLPRASVVNLSQIQTIDKGRLKEKCGQLSPAKMAQVDRAIMVSLGL